MRVIVVPCCHPIFLFIYCFVDEKNNCVAKNNLELAYL